MKTSPSSSMCNVTSLKMPFSTSKETRQSRKYVPIATRSLIMDFTQTFVMLASSGRQILSHLLKTACDLHTPCTPCPYFHLCSWTKIWTEKSSTSSSAGAWWWLSWSQDRRELPLDQAPGLFQTAWNLRKVSEKQNLGHMDKPFCV